MDLMKYKGGPKYSSFICALLSLLTGLTTGSVVLIGKNVTLSFDDIDANFAPRIKGSGECGVLYLAEPLDACTPLSNEVVEGSNPPFALIIRGGCTFDDKVTSAQSAGFKAAIVYDNEDGDGLVAMAGTPGGTNIHAVFISKASGEVLKKYSGRTDMELWIIPNFENSAWSIMAISFILLLAIAAVLATCFFVRRHRVRRERPSAPQIQEFHGMSRRLVKAIPSLIFTSVLEDNCTSRTCAICLEDYRVGEKLRILPCRHKFHAFCVDSWLTAWRTFCPVCKQDARRSTGNPLASECTPLLSSGLSSPSSTVGLSSYPSSLASSPATQIVPPELRSPSTTRTHSLSSIPHIPNPRRSYNSSYNSLAISRSSADLRNASSHRSSASHLMSPHSLGFPMSLPIHSRYGSPYIPSPSNASPSYHIGSSSRQSYLRHCNESGASLSALSSAQSLPGC